MNRQPLSLLSLFALALPVAVLPAQTPLAFGVPKDVHLFVEGRTSTSPDPGLVKLDRACRMLIESGIHEDVVDLITLDMPGEKRAAVRGAFERAFELIGGVDWQLLGQREVVFAYRIAMPFPEYLLLFRVPEGRIGGQVEAIEGMLAGFAEMVGPTASVRDVERRTGAMTVFSVEQMPVQVAAGAVGDVLVVATSSQMAAASMRLLTQDDGAGSIARDARYESSLKIVPPGTEDTTFVDLRGVLDFVGTAMNLASTQIPDVPQTQKIKTTFGVISAVIEELNVIDHMMATTASDGTTVTSNVLFKMQADAGQSRLVQLYAGQQPWSDWFEMVPADATSFYFDSGIDPAALFDLIALLAREHGVEGELGAEWVGLRGILAHFSGETASISFPSQGTTGCPLGECVCIVRLEQTEGVAELLRGSLEGCARYLGSRGQRMEVVGSGGMHEIRLAAFPWIRPVVGVVGKNLICATSAAAVEKVARVRSGQEADIRTSERFARLGVGGEAAVDYLQYAQVDESTEGFANLVSAAGFCLSLLPEDRDSRPAIKLGAILTKLAPALRELDMRYDWACELAASDGDDVELRTVIRYR